MKSINVQKVKRNGQVTIPKHIRDDFNIEDGDVLMAEIVREGILFRIPDFMNASYKTPRI